jgi:hypothetical protein
MLFHPAAARLRSKGASQPQVDTALAASSVPVKPVSNCATDTRLLTCMITPVMRLISCGFHAF